MQARKRPGRHALIALAAAAALGLGLAQAQTPAPAHAPATAGMAPAGAMLAIRDIYDRMEVAGYRDIREIEWENGRYEVKARNAQDDRVKLYVNARSGEVEHTRTDK